MKKLNLFIASLMLTGASFAQNITGSGTTNTIPLFTGTSAIGNSSLSQSANGSVNVMSGGIQNISLSPTPNGGVINVRDNAGNSKINLTASPTGNVVFNTGTCVGINTNSPNPAFMLDVNGAIKASSNEVQYNGTSNISLSSTPNGGVINVRDNAGNSKINLTANPSLPIFFNTGSNVGINTNSPNAAFMLDVNGAINTNGNINTSGYLQSITNATKTVIRAVRTDNSIEGLFTTDGFGNFEFNNDLTVDKKLHLTYNGVYNIMLESNAKGGYFNIYDNTGASKIHMSAASGDNVYFNNDGNVGIGTTSPTEKFEVANGNIKTSITSSLNYSTLGPFDLNFNREDGCGNAYIANISPIGRLVFRTGGINNRMTIDATGNVGIGTANPQSLLAVNGTITAREVDVTVNGWSDFVFANDFKLKSLSEVESYIKENKHLPDVPSEKEVLTNGVKVGEMNSILLQKIEELTLYTINLQKQFEAQNELVKKQQEAIETQNSILKKQQEAINKLSLTK